ncbi:MAG: hypothetical protein WC517_01125 [Patescibacteria group bacterium]
MTLHTGFLKVETIQFILQRNFSDIPNCLTYGDWEEGGRKIEKVALDRRSIGDITVNITVNDVEISGVKGISLFSSNQYYLMEISSTATGYPNGVFSLTHSFPLDGIWQFSVSKRIKTE